MHTSLKATIIAALLGFSSVASALPGGSPPVYGSSSEAGGVGTCKPSTVTVTKTKGGSGGKTTVTETSTYTKACHASTITVRVPMLPSSLEALLT